MYFSTRTLDDGSCNSHFIFQILSDMTGRTHEKACWLLTRLFHNGIYHMRICMSTNSWNMVFYRTNSEINYLNAINLIAGHRVEGSSGSYFLAPDTFVSNKVRLGIYFGYIHSSRTFWDVFNSLCEKFIAKTFS